MNLSRSISFPQNQKYNVHCASVTEDTPLTQSFQLMIYGLNVLHCGNVACRNADGDRDTAARERLITREL